MRECFVLGNHEFIGLDRDRLIHLQALYHQLDGGFFVRRVVEPTHALADRAHVADEQRAVLGQRFGRRKKRRVLQIFDLVGVVEQHSSAGLDGFEIVRRRLGQRSSHLARRDGLKSFRTATDEKQGVSRRRDTAALHDVFEDCRGDACEGRAGDLLAFEIGQGLELRVADHLIGITVVRAADDFDLGAAGGGDHAEVGARSRQVDCAGDERLDDQVRRHVGRFDIEVLLGEKAFVLGGDIVNVERRRIGRANRYLVGGERRSRRDQENCRDQGCQIK